jgi:two-component system, LytTR family, sensor kinase
MDNKKLIFFRYRVLWHILFWVMCYLFYAVTYGAYNDKYCGEFIANLYLLPIRIAGTYVLIYYLIPCFLLKRKYVAFSILAILHVCLYGIIIAYAIHIFIYCPTCIYWKENPFGIRLILESIASNYEIPAVAATIVIFKNLYLHQQQNQALEKEKLEAELKFLKSQINPHFLFNTLNNLYALTLKKSDKAPDVVIKLSEMLDYMLYNSNEKEVKLTEEIKLIENYLELEKIRYGDRLKQNIEIKGSDGGKYIAPLIILPFIENSFKHGVSSAIHNPFVDISLQISDKCLELSVKNSFNEQTVKENYSEGIGLKNVIRRLELLYPNRHELKIVKQNNTFEVYLCINWTNNKT